MRTVPPLWPLNKTGCKVARLHNSFTAVVTWPRVAGVKLHHLVLSHILYIMSCRTNGSPNTDVATPLATPNAAARNAPGIG